ncbi:MAG: ORF6N domain-containing protein [Bacteroidales bacterium]|nr:ORF6N domain-containing protein [Bacteroidales bacterium]
MAKKDTETKLEVAICDIKGIDSINIESLIRVIRGQQVMLDSDLAMLYGVETKRLNEQVKRNSNRFPEDFMFQLTQDEAVRSRSQIATLNTQRGQNLKYLPYAFTRNGIAMLSSVLRSDTAVEVNIRIMRAFTMIPQLVNHNTQIIERIFNIEQHQQETDKTIKVILDRIEDVSPKLLPEQVFPTGCVWDAWSFISDLVRSARQRIVLIDNYVDDRVLSMFTKREDGVSATIYTRHNEQFLTDLKKHNAQYPEIEFIQLPHRNHDRFLIIDDKVYLLGASLKDMGMGLCAVTEMAIEPETILELLK